jgi:Cu(I)/Ag(I) efflux system membrane fusion protein
VVPNSGELKPDLYADIDFESGASRRLMVPAEAVLDAGTSKTMFLDKGEGRFEQRQVETGERVGDRVEIVHGLAAGERYAASGVFLLNSDSQMKAESK